MEIVPIACHLHAFFSFLSLPCMHRNVTHFPSPAQSSGQERMAPYGDGTKWIIQAPKTKARPTAIPRMAKTGGAKLFKLDWGVFLVGLLVLISLIVGQSRNGLFQSRNG
uniref:Uncharacterized protein n=1 Tax=Arundo donax TaxID=35708 RepID=A0A0A9ENH4_ARUDO